MKHWIFDLDGTLVDSGGQYFGKIRKIFSHFNIEHTEDDILFSHNFFNAEEYFSLYFPKDKVTHACKMLTALSLQQAPTIKVFQRIHELLNHLRECDVKLSIWTGRDLESAALILEENDLDQYFDIRVSGTCVVNKKPHPEGLLKVLGKRGFEASDSVMIGDHVFDIQPAKNLGMKTVGVNWRKTYPCVLKPLADVCFYEPQDFIDWTRKSMVANSFVDS